MEYRKGKKHFSYCFLVRCDKLCQVWFTWVKVHCDFWVALSCFSSLGGYFASRNIFYQMIFCENSIATILQAI